MGRFVTFEGLDGCGKSTQVELLAARLRSLGHDVLMTREPGGTAMGERLRALVVRDDAGPEPAAATELGIMCVSRAQSVAEVILPALRRGAWVICDRFHDATEAYQGGGRGLDRAEIRTLHRILCRGLQPDRTLILDLDPATSLERARLRLGSEGAEGRFERQAPEFFVRVAQAYREIAAREPGRCRMIPADGDVAEVERQVWAALSDLVAAEKRP